MNFYRHREPEKTFDPVAHKWLVEADNLFLFVWKESDRFTSQVNLDDFDQIPLGDVPRDVRKKAGQRLGYYRSQAHKVKGGMTQ